MTKPFDLSITGTAIPNKAKKRSAKRFEFASKTHSSLGFYCSPFGGLNRPALTKGQNWNAWYTRGKGNNGLAIGRCDAETLQHKTTPAALT